MAYGSTTQTPPASRTTEPIPAVDGDPGPDEMMGLGEAAEIIGRDARTLTRWVDSQKIRGGRPRDPITGEHVAGSHRWVDARHAVAYAVGAGRAHLIPDRWRSLIPSTALPTQRAESSTNDAT